MNPWSEVEQYARNHRRQFNPPRQSGLVVTDASHVGEAPAASNETWEIAEEVKREIDLIRHTGDPWKAMDGLGIFWEYMNQIQALNPKAEGGTPPPPPPGPVVLNEYGTYQGHGLAVDLYPLGRGQNSKGFVRALPIDVRLEAYQFQGPLDAAYRIEKVVQVSPEALGLVGILGTSLHTRVAYPLQPLKGGMSGREIKAFWVTHVKADSGTGMKRANEPMWIVWDSGIEFERLGIKADAAHEHWAISYSGQLSPNGEGDPADLFAAFGWQVRNVGVVPGPQEYLGRRGWRGLIQAPPA